VKVSVRWYYRPEESIGSRRQFHSSTLYPGFMVIAALLYWTLRLLSFAVHIRKVCVLTTLLFASNTTLVSYPVRRFGFPVPDLQQRL
jgi:dolichyl-diphosphooligosaccharide--protein glycosyltransferase